MLEDGIVAVPLHVVGPAHERGVLGGASVVMPQVEIGELDFLAERIGGDEALGFQSIHDGLGGEDFFVGGVHHGGAFLEDAVHERRRVALQADVFHLGLRAFGIRPGRGDFGEQVVRQTVGGIMRDAATV